MGSRITHLRLKATGLHRTNVYAEGVREASNCPRPRARFSQKGHGGGKRNQPLRGTGLGVKREPTGLKPTSQK